MAPNESEPFGNLLKSLRATFGGQPLTQAEIEVYWHALKDVPFSVVQRVAAQHVRYGKFFPKPVELRPREERAPAMTESGDDGKAAEAKLLNRMDWDRVDAPVAFAVAFNIAHCAKQLVGLVEGQPGYAEALREYRYWTDIDAKPFAQQCQALPTFAAEHDMTRAQRIERMKYIQSRRAQGIKANQLTFPRAVPPRALPEATRGPD